MPHLELCIERDDTRIRIRGPLDLHHFHHAKEILQHMHGADNKATIIDLSEVTRLDTAGALLLHNLCNATKQPLALENFSAKHKVLFDLVDQINLGKSPIKKRLSSWIRTVTRVGKATMDIWPATFELISFMGLSWLMLIKALKHPTRFRFISITHQIEAIGINAVPIISLIALVISIVLAYQGQAQLKPLGMKQYTVDLIAISVLREMGVLLTAIMVAGRSGSAFTAEIGTMKVRQEIDALRSMGFDPFELLILPRLIALLVVLPLLTLLADIMGLFGGALISLSLIDMALPEYLERARHAITGKDFLVGMIKAPVFAFVIAQVGCMHGLKVSGSSESVGKETTTSVVKSIFLVLILDGLFSIYFQKVGL
ncbi:MAG TPA: MlaE family lipid ABC transporter permease subunit [Gammaproteobacteria bacterium]|nr:MlaE family lipid ABC transporter permease subunit [Gammaproteobacteria bacterium]